MALRLVAPLSYSNNNNSTILGLLKNYTPSKPENASSTTLIPVSTNLDVDALIRQNDKRTPRGQGLTASEKTLDVDDDDLEALAEDVAELDPPNWVSLPDFSPQHRLHQINTVFLQDFPSLKKTQLVRCMNLFLALCELSKPKNFIFTFISETLGRDVRGVFLRFLSLEVTRWALRNFAKVFPDVAVVYDPELNANSAEEMLEDALDSLKAEINKLVANKRNYSHGTKRTGTEDLDEVMKYYRTYKVENSELVEVPRELKEVIVKDILKFRSKVLKIERERRKQEIENERKRARNRLTKIYEGLKAAASVGGEPDDAEMDDESLEDDSLNALTDAEYEAHLKEQDAMKERLQCEEYSKELDRLETKEKAPLLAKLEQGAAYEETLVDNKIVYMDEIRVLLELDVASAAKSNHSRARLYYTNNAEYMRLRNQERIREEELDAADELEEAKMKPSVVSAQIRTTPSIVESNGHEESKEELKKNRAEDMDADFDVSALSTELLASVKRKISDLVEEYLGIKEELLIEFIYEFVAEKGTDGKEELVTELQETLDEDSVTVVKELHSFMKSL